METVVTRDSVLKAYRRYAHFYDLLFGPIFHPGRRTAVQCLNCQAGERILEVGVGTGLSLSMYPPNVSVVGIDLSSDMLQAAQRKAESEGLSQVEALIEMDAQRMEFPEDSFDKVVAMYVASVVPDYRLLMKEVKRVCKPGGTIILLNHFENKNPIIRAAESLIQPFAKYLGFHPDFPLEKFLKETNFRVLQQVPVNLLHYWTILIGKNDKTIPH